MIAMTTEQAIAVLEKGGQLTELVEAVGIVCSDPATSFEAILPALQHAGFVAEQAALALYKRTFRPLPADRSLLVTDRHAWADWLAERGLGHWGGSAGAQVNVLAYGRRAQRKLASAKAKQAVDAIIDSHLVVVALERWISDSFAPATSIFRALALEPAGEFALRRIRRDLIDEVRVLTHLIERPDILRSEERDYVRRLNHVLDTLARLDEATAGRLA